MPHPLILPMTAHVALATLLYVLLTIARAPSIWGIGRRPDGSNPWATIEPRISANLSNQFELPVLFYVLTILGIISKHADLLFVVMAWIFVLTRLAHAFVHCTSNNLRVRGSLFGIGALVLAIMWLIFMIRIMLGLP